MVRMTGMPGFEEFVDYSPYVDYFIGLDPGKRRDPTALAVVERSGPAGRAHYAVTGLLRAPLNTSYTGVVESVGRLVRSPRLHPRRATRDERGRDRLTDSPNPCLIIDATGLGVVVADLFIEAKDALPASINPLTITAGGTSRSDVWASPMRPVTCFFVPKLELVAVVLATFESRRLEIAAGLELGETLRRELVNFEIKVTQSGHEIFNAREGKHDDLVLAVAMAVWRAEYRDPRPVATMQFGPNFLGNYRGWSRG